MGVVNYLTIDGEIVSETRNGVKSDYIPDPLGSTSKLVNTSQTVTDVFEFWPYGELRLHSGGSGTPFRFVGTMGYYTHSPSTRLYIRARHYLAGAARWLTVDSFWPYVEAYSYVSTRPTTSTDPLGLAEWIECRCGFYCIGPIYSHAFLRVKGCGFGAGVDTCGFWPSEDAKWYKSVSGNVQCPDPNAKNIVGGNGSDCCKVVKVIGDPAFDQALCDCIKDSMKSPPRYNILCLQGGINCGNWVQQMLTCAKLHSIFYR